MLNSTLTRRGESAAKVKAMISICSDKLPGMLTRITSITSRPAAEIHVTRSNHCSQFSADRPSSPVALSSSGCRESSSQAPVRTEVWNMPQVAMEVKIVERMKSAKEKSR